MLIKNDHIIKNAEAIIHLGACSSTTETDASYLIDNNFQFSKDIANFAINNNTYMLYASSAATYGSGDMGYIDDENNIHKLKPLNMYGYSKQIFDLWCRKNKLFSKFAALKFTNVFGPNEWHKGDMRSLICKAFDQISDTGKLKLFKSYLPQYKDGEQMRDFLYIKDAVMMINHILSNKITGIFNIGSGKPETWNYLANAIFKAMDLPPIIQYIDMPEHLKDKYQYYTKADMNKFNKNCFEMEYTPLNNAISDYVKNYLMTNNRLDPLKTL
jgi:ADP-L-glycero-D-manno-heptose 6-epimerase